MNLTFLCFNTEGDTICSKCHKTIAGAHHRGVWFPERQFEPNSASRGYVYALCMPCNAEVIDPTTKMPHKTWLRIIEDEIQERLTLKRGNRIKLDTSKMNEKEVFEEQMFLLTGRRVMT